MGPADTVYGRLVAETYDALYSTTPYDAVAEAATVLRRARRALRRDVTSLLDVACGTGAHLARWRRSVDDVAGVDVSEAMVATARAALADDVRLEVADFRDFDLGRTFDVVTCLFSSIGYVRDHDELDAAVAAMARHVAPGGILLVEPWITPEDWLGERMSVDVADGRVGAEVVRVLQTFRDGDVVRMDWLVARPGRDALDVVREQHETLLVSRERYLAAFARAGLAADWEEPGLKNRERGLVVATRSV